jgi:two-component system sensor kinase FixL
VLVADDEPWITKLVAITLSDGDSGSSRQAAGIEALRKAKEMLGIGLSVCQRVIDSLGGRIWARPREGGGTEAGFALPQAEVAPD